MTRVRRGRKPDREAGRNTVGTDGSAATLDARAAGNVAIAAKLQSVSRDEQATRRKNGRRRDLLHSAHESLVAPRLRFFTGSGAGVGGS